MKPADALLFDLGGVVMGLDWDRAFQRWAQACGADAGKLRSRYAFDEAYERHERGEIGELEYYAALRQSLGLGIGDDDMRAGWGAIFTEPVHETVALLEKLKGRVPLYAFSNTNEAHYAVWSRKFEPQLRNFSRVFLSSRIGLRKPEAASFEHVTREIGVAPARILFLDDTPANVEGARRAGLQAIHVQRPQDVRDAVRPWL